MDTASANDPVLLGARTFAGTVMTALESRIYTPPEHEGLTHRGWDRMAAIFQRHFQIDFLERTLQWRQNGRDSVSYHQPHDCLLNRLFKRRSKKKSKLRVTGLCVGNSPVTGEFPAQMSSIAENVSIWWCYHEIYEFRLNFHWGLWLIQIMYIDSDNGLASTGRQAIIWTNDG